MSVQTLGGNNHLRSICKRHNSFNHTTKVWCAFKNILEEKINDNQESQVYQNSLMIPTLNGKANTDAKEHQNENTNHRTHVWITKVGNMDDSTSKNVAKAN